MDMGFVDWSSEDVKEFIERDRTAVFPVVSHLFLYSVCALLDDKEYIALVVHCDLNNYSTNMKSRQI